MFIKVNEMLVKRGKIYPLLEGYHYFFLERSTGAQGPPEPFPLSPIMLPLLAHVLLDALPSVLPVLMSVLPSGFSHCHGHLPYILVGANLQCATPHSLPQKAHRLVLFI
jgi:hypothetical protein